MLSDKDKQTFGKKNSCLAFRHVCFFSELYSFPHCHGFMQEKMSDVYRKDGTDKFCDNGMRNTVEVPFAFFHTIMNLHFALFLTLRV